MTIINIKARSTDSIESYQKLKHSNDSFVYSNPLLADDYALEVQIGRSWSNDYDEDHYQMYEIPDQGIKIPKGKSIVIESKQEIIAPPNAYGIVMPTGRLFLGKGIILSPAKVEPAFRGKLRLRLFNTGNESRVIKPDDIVASIIFFKTEGFIEKPEFSHSARVTKQKKSRTADIVQWIKQNPDKLIGWFVQVAVSALAVKFIFPK